MGHANIQRIVYIKWIGVILKKKMGCVCVDSINKKQCYKIKITMLLIFVT